MLICECCGTKLKKSNRSYCSNQCQQNQRYSDYITSWRAGKKDGSRGVNTKNFSGHVIRYLRDKYGEKCQHCSWNVRNSVTNRVPLEIDHIDGNPDNNTEINLRLLCPNCHALTSNYRNLNYGHGRQWRRNKL